MTSSAALKSNIDLRELSNYEIEQLSSTCLSQITTVIEERFGKQYDHQKKYMLCIQGSSSSGKSTLAYNIYNMLVKSGVGCFLLEIDRYYKTFSQRGAAKVEDYDFDNPAAIDWEKVNSVLRALDNNDEYLPLYEYSFITKICKGPFMTKNSFPSVVIIEGIYAFNTINEKVFNLSEFDPHESKKIIKKKFVTNPNFFASFCILRMRLAICKTKSLAVRIARDIVQRNKTEEEANKQFERQVWPATIKWVNNNVFAEDMRIIHGSFNENKVKLLVCALSQYFLSKTVSLQAITCEGNYKSCFEVPCSKECGFKCQAKLILEDK